MDRISTGNLTMNLDMDRFFLANYRFLSGHVIMSAFKIGFKEGWLIPKWKQQLQ